MEYNWVKINSEYFKFQYYHADFKVFSWSYKNADEDSPKKILNEQINNGYKFLYIYNIDGKRKKIYIHRLIYFFQNVNIITSCSICKIKPSIFHIYDNEHHIDHIDGNNFNNHYSNLQRICPSCHGKKTVEQTKDTKKNGALKRANKVIAFKEYDESYQQIFNTATEASRILELDNSSVSKSAKLILVGEIKWVGSKKHNDKYRFELIEAENIDGEIWKKVDGSDVQISNKGRVKNNNVISYGFEKNGYMKVHFQGKSHFIHRLVMKTFKMKKLREKALEIKEIYDECSDMSIEDIINTINTRYSIVVDHIDRNKKNNCLENLRWSSQRENSINQESVYEIEQWSLDRTILINTYKSQMEASDETGVNNSLISAVCCNKSNDAGGYFWKFKTQSIHESPVSDVSTS